MNDGAVIERREHTQAPLVLPFEGISSVDLPRVGGKAANLGELTRAGFPVPPGFCVSTLAFDAFLAGRPELDAAYESLEALDGKDVDLARRAAEQMRAALTHVPTPAAVEHAVLAAWNALDPAAAYAVRSSATAEDLPGASFAGQHDTFLNVRGSDALLDALRRCWLSLFTDRAVLYRARGGFGQRAVKLAVVIQRMLRPELSGILFTADPVSGHRGTVSIDAGYGLGEALVSGLVNADLYRVDKASGALLEVRVGDKALAIWPLLEGGTRQEALSDELRHARVLDAAAVSALVALGKNIEAHYGEPQDIEWCSERGQLFVVQARPITSLYPLPEPRPSDPDLHVYGSFGHFQMMIDPLPPVSIEAWRLLLSFGKDEPHVSPREARAVTEAGSRIYLDLTGLLRQPLLGRVFPLFLSHMYEALGRGLMAVSERPEFRRGKSSWAAARAIASFLVPLLTRLLMRLAFADPDALRPEVEAFGERVVAEMRRRLQAAAPGAERLREARRVLVATFPRVFTRVPPSIAAGIVSQRLLVVLAEHRVIEASREDLSLLERGLPGNITTEMDLAVADLVDRVRAAPELAELLRTRPIAAALELAPTLEGGPAFAEAWHAFLQRYGMRGPGEIDLGRPRYIDDPAPLVSVILGGLGLVDARARTDASSLGERPVDGRPVDGRPVDERPMVEHGAGAHRVHHATLARDAGAAALRLDAAARRGFWGPLRAPLVRRLVRLARAGSGLREHPKFLLVRIFGLVRAALREAGARLVERGSLSQVDDVYLFRFEELCAALEAPTPLDLRSAAAERRARLAADAQRSPPFVMTSDGEVPTLAARTDIPANALSGTAASSGVVEGPARVVLDPAREVLQRGEILVAPHTDPGWTPLFVHAAGLVTEVGGLMTHGSVVAREYGIPAVVSVSGATQRIVTGQRIRVDGTRGFVELLS
jgi:phosphohistidine swiveling domain-containing protein